MEHLEGRILNIQSEIRDNINWLNCGGCGIFAYMICKELANYGVDAEILILDENCLEGRKEYLNSKLNGEPYCGVCDPYLAFDHCLVRVGSLVFDGADFENNLENFVGTYTKEEMEIAIAKEEDWNEMYNREQNELLQNIIKANLI